MICPKCFKNSQHREISITNGKPRVECQNCKSVYTISGIELQRKDGMVWMQSEGK